MQNPCTCTCIKLAHIKFYYTTKKGFFYTMTNRTNIKWNEKGSRPTFTEYTTFTHKLICVLMQLLYLLWMLTNFLGVDQGRECLGGDGVDLHCKNEQSNWSMHLHFDFG